MYLSLMGIHQATEQAHAIAGEPVQVKGMPTILAGDLRVGAEARLRGRELRRGAVQEAGQVEPIEDIAPPVAARRPPGFAGGEVHLSPGLVQLLGNLAAGLPRPGDQHRSRRQGGRVAILPRVELQDARGDARRVSRDLRLLEHAAGNHHVAGAQVAAGGFDPVAMLQRLNRCHCHAVFHRKVVAAGIVLEMAHNLLAPHVSVRLVAGVLAARQTERPVGRDQCEGIPAVIPPGMSGLGGFLEDSVLAPRLLQ